MIKERKSLTPSCCDRSGWKAKSRTASKIINQRPEQSNLPTK